MRKLVLLLLSIIMLGGQLLAQTRTITGKVTDAKGNPVPNASVVVKGTAVGTTTDANGNYSLAVPANAKVLVISSVGLEENEYTIGNKSSIDASLAAEDKNLQEVVVVGYGVQKRKQVTASVAKIDPTPVAKIVTPSIDNQLAGRATGLQITNGSGLANDPPRIRIRGVNSISGNRDPLIVLDGVPTFSGGFSGVSSSNALADINPADIESIEVLKDGSATAIYGSRAANGVLLITTKKGKSGKANINYGVTFGFAQPGKRFDLLNAQEFVTIANEKFRNAGQTDQAFMNSENTDTDWQDYVYRSNAKSQIHTLNIDGGNDKTRYYLSFNYSNQEGMVRTNFAKRYGIRANIEHKINNWLKIGNNLSVSRTDDNDQNNGGNALSGAVANSLRALPNVRIFDPANTVFDGYNVLPDGSALGRDANLRTIENNYTNIAFVLDRNKYNSEKYRVINNAFVEVRPIKNLIYTLRASVDYQNGLDFQSLDPRHGDGRSVRGLVFNQSLNRNRFVLQNVLNYSESWGNHNLAATGGYEVQRDVSKFFSAQGQDIASLFYQTDNIISGSYVTQQSGGSMGKSGFTSLFGRLSYNFADKYFIEGSIRRDGQSSLAEANRYGTFPGVSVGWRVSQEGFWSGLGLDKTINEFKLRASWATVGNALGGFPALTTFGLAPYGAVNGIAFNSLGNPDLLWEKNEKLDFGFDMGLLNSRINLTFDYFINKNNDQVLFAPLPTSLGVPGNGIFQNIGDMENKGYEIAINATVINKKDFSWDINFNYTNVKNTVKELYLNQDVISNYNILRVGQPINAIYGYEYAGVNSGNGNPMYRKADGTLIQGNIANSTYYTVVKEDDPALGTQSSLTGGDRKVLASALPTYFGGFSNNFRYKGFELNIFFRYSGGNKIMNLTRQEALMSQAFLNNGKEILERWTAAGDVTNVPRLWYGRDNFTNLQGFASSRFVESGNFIRLDNLQLAYNLNPATLKRMTNNAISSVRFFIQGQNLWLITDYKGIDPENISEGGIDNNTVPQPRILSAGLNIGF
ncbi:TonB-dependent receptor [Flavihumibacter rivuli]|uniref:SusC/RagA family TonB-linked outer membrane protein n=1 Tax=Flavihumibacter rivuli TaxID=2838156 RepID=UPI001BDEB44D|nr:TonB-dependent receptor [Flavihumibacter rivuli]ULQ55107.1 TonB-dependent receptor [Flavihumibacter rivuli]